LTFSNKKNKIKLKKLKFKKK